MSSDAVFCRSATEGHADLREAVICIPDICRSPSKSADEERQSRDTCGSRQDPAHNKDKLDKCVCNKALGKDHSPCKKCSKCQSPSDSTKSEALRSPMSSPQRSSLKQSSVSHGRRSPRNHCPLSPSSEFPSVLNKDTSVLNKDTESLSSPNLNGERPKINIFTDNLGVELGKRVRSPRRLSQDMIPLPIYSVRRTGNSSKESVLQKNEETPLRESDSEAEGQETFFKSPAGSSIVGKRSSNQKQKGSVTETTESSSCCSVEDQSSASSKKQKTYSFRKPKSQIDQNSPGVKTKANCDELCSENCFVVSDSDKEAENNSIEWNGSCSDVDLCKNGEMTKCAVTESETNITSVKVSTKITIPEETFSKFDKKISELDDKIVEDQGSSILCAMLVGGTDVARSYYMGKRDRYKPEVTEISDSEVDLLQDASSSALPSSVRMKLDIKKEFKEDDKDENLVESEDCEEVNVKEECDASKEECEEDFVQNGAVKIEDNETNEEAVKEDTVKLKQCKEMKINFSEKLKNLNEGVLKLLDIDVEEQFLNGVCEEEESEGFEPNPVDSETHSKLYNTISSLCDWLKISGVNDSTEESLNEEQIDSMLVSCPKHAKMFTPNVCRKKWERIMQRLNTEEQKSSSSTDLSQPSTMEESNVPQTFPEGHCKETSINEPMDISEETPRSLSDLALSYLVRTKAASSVCGDGVSSSVSPLASSSFPGLTSASSSSFNDSLCDLDVDAMTTAATQFLKHEDSPSLNSLVDIPSTSATAVVSNPRKDGDDVVNLKRSFQKAKTCSDFSATMPLPSASKLESGSLRRVNSSPQLNAKTSSPVPSGSIALKESQTKSKLGSKIPVPSTSTTVIKKSWRVPRIIMEPKSFKILSQVEQKNGNKNVFFSSELQKYLRVPSNHIIVDPSNREEIKLADAKAEEMAVYQDYIKIKEETTPKSKQEEDFEVDFSKHEPDFDEVEGMLFMSFSSEIELRAHVHVERALEWDKDNTMLRISRAKAFEEAKALNGDMKGLKMRQLRGQHMRWKKYRRLYSGEVKALMVAQGQGISLDQITKSKKTSDITKIKGWRRKSGVLETPSQDLKENVQENISFRIPKLHTPHLSQQANCSTSVTVSIDDGYQDDFLPPKTEEVDRRELSPRSRRRLGFSDQKAHKQLFRELNMDWTDRMIHRKLGGWSLKGNRPKAHSRAAMRRMEKQKGFADPLEVSVESPDLSIMEQGSDLSPGSTAQVTRKRKIVYPMLTERMARNSLKTLETGDVVRALKKRKKKRRCHSYDNAIPSLTPMPPVVLPALASTLLPGGNVKILKDDLTAPTVSTSTLVSPATAPLVLDLPEESVMEGVEIVSQTSSPSVTDAQSSPHIKSCKKPGCRYGCICHLCSASEGSVPPSPVVPSAAKNCDKEYCRLGCICDSLDPEKSIPTQTHCRKPSCMLSCVCSEPWSATIAADASDEVPYLPSMKRKPKVGERFSNLPQREKTHRSAKNVDAITRKAMMLYETSEIYCEKSERARKKPEMSVSPNSWPIGALSGSTSSSTPATPTAINTPALPVTVKSESAMGQYESLSSESSSSDQNSKTMFQAVNLVTSRVASVAASHVLPSPCAQIQKQWYPEAVEEPEIEASWQSMPPVFEPSAHKRKRKSHPLSDEIFTNSTCARTQPFLPKRERGSRRLLESLDKGSNLTAMSAILQKAGSLKQHQQQVVKVEDDSRPGNDLPQLQITSVESLSAQPINSAIPRISDTLMPSQSQTMTSKLLPFSHSGGANRTGEEMTPENKSQPNHGWHTSMVCLKARSSYQCQAPGEEDVQEEDEVKLLEFAANCNWEGAKKEILGRVAQCLTRGQYPSPKAMNVCEFVVEILPKAHQPSIIPAELRAKLPEQMFSIRVRITRRESDVGNNASSIPVIDLRESSPSKKVSETAELSKRQAGDKSHVKQLSTNSSLPSLLSSAASLSTSSSTPLSSTTSTSLPTSVSLSASFGISGLSQMCINRASQDKNVIHKAKSAPGSRRSSLDHYKEEKSLHSADDFHIMADKSGAFSKERTQAPLSVKTTVSNIISASGTKKAFSATSPPLTTVSCLTQAASPNFPTSSFKSILMSSALPAKAISSAPVSLLTPSNLSISRKPVPGARIAANLPNPTVIKGMAPLVRPINSKDLKYVIPSSEAVMFYGVDPNNSDKKQAFIALPISLPSKSPDGKVKQTLPVVAMPMNNLMQTPVVPLLSSRPKSKGRGVPSVVQLAPNQAVSPSHSIAGKRPVMVCSGQEKMNPTGMVQLVPISLPTGLPRVHGLVDRHGSDAVIKTEIKEEKEDRKSKVAEDRSEVLRSSGDDVSVPCVTDDANNPEKTANDFKPLVSLVAEGGCSNPESIVRESERIGTGDAQEDSKKGILSTTVTASRSRPIMSSEVLLTEKQEVAIEHPESPNNSSQRGDKINVVDVVGACHGQELPQDLSTKSHNSEPFLQADSTTNAASSHQTKLNSSLPLGTEMLGQMSPASKFQGTQSLEAALRKNLSMSQEIIISSNSSSPSPVPNVAPKRNAEDEECPSTKRACLSGADEDSNTSFVSVGGTSVYASFSPLSSANRPKSGLSNAISTGSSDDYYVPSSEEEIDVGEEEYPAFSNCSVEKDRSGKLEIDSKSLFRRAVENDHSAMYSKQPQQRKTVNKVKKPSAPTQSSWYSNEKLEYHNKLERMRRAKLKELFDALAATIQSIPEVAQACGIVGNAQTSKVAILQSATQAVKFFEQKDNIQNNQMCELLNVQHGLKGDLLQKNMSERAIEAIVNKISPRSRKEVEAMEVAENGAKAEQSMSCNVANHKENTSAYGPASFLSSTLSLSLRPSFSVLASSSPKVRKSKVQISPEVKLETCNTRPQSEVRLPFSEESIVLMSDSMEEEPTPTEAKEQLVVVDGKGDGLPRMDADAIDTVNLVSPSTDDGKCSEDPIYEDISDSETGGLPYEDISDPEAGQQSRYEDISDIEDENMKQKRRNPTALMEQHATVEEKNLG